MKKQTKSNKNPTGLPELLVVLLIIVVLILLILLVRSCTPNESGTPDPSQTDTNHDSPNSTELNPIPFADVVLPVSVTSAVTVDNIFTATGYYPEDGTDDGVENVLAAKFTNTSDKVLEYMTVVLKVNSESYNFAITTLPAGKSVYVFNSDRKTAPDVITSLSGVSEYEIYFDEEPEKMEESIASDVQNGLIVVKNISDKDITSDIVIYYKSKTENGYLGGITYRLRVPGGLKSGETYNAYAPHSYAHMTEVMFVKLETQTE